MPMPAEQASGAEILNSACFQIAEQVYEDLGRSLRVGAGPVVIYKFYREMRGHGL